MGTWRCPPLESGERRDRLVSFWATNKQAEALDKMASEYGVSRAFLIRALCTATINGDHKASLGRLGIKRGGGLK